MPHCVICIKSIGEQKSMVTKPRTLGLFGHSGSGGMAIDQVNVYVWKCILEHVLSFSFAILTAFITPYNRIEHSTWIYHTRDRQRDGLL